MTALNIKTGYEAKLPSAFAQFLLGERVNN